MSDRDLLRRIYEMVAANHTRLLRIESEITHMALDFTALHAAVANETTIDQSVVTLLTTLAANLKTANDANDQEAIAEIVGTMQSNAASVAAAITSNTPAASVAAPAPVGDTGPATTAVNGLSGTTSVDAAPVQAALDTPVPPDTTPAT